MSGHKLEIDRAAGAGSVWIETDDIADISPVKDGQHAATVTLRWRSEYQDGGFVWIPGVNSLRMQVLPRQVRAAVEQLRSAQEGYCNGERESGCFDYGKTANPPASCVRCLLLEACRRSGQGDFRKASPPAVDGPGVGMTVALWLAILFGWWALCQWSGAAREAEQVRMELAGCRAKQSPTARR